MKRTWREISHPREGFHFESLTPDRQSAAIASVESLGGGGSNAGKVRQTIATNLTTASGEIRDLESAGKSVPAKKYRQLAVLKKGHEEAQSLPATGMEASVKTIKDTAMMPVKAVRAHAKETGEMLGVSAGEFYPERSRIGEAIGSKVFGKGSEESYRLQVASPTLSARMAPQKEVAAAAGMASVIKGGGEIGIDIGHTAARYLSHEFRGAGGRPPVEAGSYSFDEIARSHPHVASMLLQHGANASGLVVPTGKQEQTEAKKAQVQALSGQSGARVHIPDLLEAPTAAFVSGYGITGHPKGARALARFHSDPESFGGFDFHKIPSYTWNINNAQSISKGTHHFLGALAHGDRWFAAHPDAEDHIRRASAHPAWNDPTSTIDVWSGRAASGLPYHVARSLGEVTNPEDIMGFAGAGKHRFSRQPGGLGKASDLGYLYGEEAHRRAGAAMSVRLPGGGRVAMPGHIAQSLSWYGVQAQEYPGKIKSGEKTLVPKNARDPRGLNPLRMPMTWS
jgi:hypothetical protein